MPTPPELVITDVMMPTMDGLEFIECLRSDPETAAIPILFEPLELLAAAAVLTVKDRLEGVTGVLGWSALRTKDVIARISPP